MTTELQIASRASQVMRVVAAFLLAVALLIALAPGSDALAQETVPGGTLGQKSDSDIWRQMKEGVPGTVAGQNEMAGRLIQVQGDQWWRIRNGPLAMYSAWALLGMLALLALFFGLRGRIRIDHGRTGHTVTRFTLIERTAHWLLASSFIVLGLTGLNLLFGRSLLLPLIGKDAFAAITLAGKYLHNYFAFAFIAALIVIFLMWVLHNLPNRHDLVWILKGGGLFGGDHPPARKFNAGQKIFYWLVIICGASISLTGWALLFPFTTGMFSGTFALVNSVFGTSLATDLTPLQEQQLSALWHTIMAVFLMAVVLAHIYIGSIGMEGALGSVTHGEVDDNWALEHHSIWMEELQAKEAQRAAAADEAPAPSPAE